MRLNDTNLWLKNRGYLHLSPQSDLDTTTPIKKIKNKKYIAQYAFYPLLHSIIKERRFKKVSGLRAHSHNGKSTVKNRPLHYATHHDSMIYGYYAEILQDKYEKLLTTKDKLGDCIIAYRKLADPSTVDKNKSTINFAKETFDEIKSRSINGCAVLKFDIEKYFSSLNHIQLKQKWIEVLGEVTLSADHYNVFKATTRFSYILKDDLRLYKSVKGRRPGFDEKALAKIRKTGISAFFGSAQEFRESIKCGDLKIYKNPFRDADKKMKGIPQGLPISAVLANLYLLDFDLSIYNDLVKQGAFYRRYSDDIIIICDLEKANEVEKYVLEKIKESKVEISPDKTESFRFKRVNGKVYSFKVENEVARRGVPFTYLGFEFYGEKTLIKSANLAKFYRRMIYAVKRKVKRAVMIAKSKPDTAVVIYRRQLYKLYSSINLKKTEIKSTRKRLVKNKWGDFIYESKPINRKLRSNYFTYVKRASRIMDDKSIEKQVRNHRKIFNQAINRHLKREIERTN